MGQGEMEVEAMVRPVVEAAGLELVDVSFARERGRRVLRVLVDRDRTEGGLDLEAISEVSERIGRRLDLEGFDPPGGPYVLEVGSPGLERPLRAPRDFERRVGEKVKVRASRPEGGHRTLEGAVVAVGPDSVRIAADGGEVDVAFDDIAAARTVFEWGPGPKPGRSKGARREKKTKKVERG